MGVRFSRKLQFSSGRALLFMHGSAPLYTDKDDQDPGDFGHSGCRHHVSGSAALLPLLMKEYDRFLWSWGFLHHIRSQPSTFIHLLVAGLDSICHIHRRRWLRRPHENACQAPSLFNCQQDGEDAGNNQEHDIEYKRKQFCFWTPMFILKHIRGWKWSARADFRRDFGRDLKGWERRDMTAGQLECETGRGRAHSNIKMIFTSNVPASCSLHLRKVAGLIRDDSTCRNSWRAHLPLTGVHEGLPRYYIITNVGKVWYRFMAVNCIP